MKCYIKPALPPPALLRFTCLSACLYLTIFKTGELIGPKFCVRSCMTPGMNAQSYKKFYPKALAFM